MAILTEVRRLETLAGPFLHFLAVVPLFVGRQEDWNELVAALSDLASRRSLLRERAPNGVLEFGRTGHVRREIHGHPGRARGDQALKARCVSLWTLSKEVGVYIGTMKTRPDRAGAKPAFDSAKIGAKF